MTQEELEKEAIERVDAFIDNFSQDVRSTLYDRFNQEDVKDFLYGLYIDSAEPREKKIESLGKRCLLLQKDKDNLINKVDDLEEKLANADYQLEGRDLEIKELKAQLEQEKNLSQCMSDHNEQLRELIEKIKQCGNCGNRTIGNCEYCKRKPNQILADTLTSDYWKLKEIKENA